MVDPNEDTYTYTSGGNYKFKKNKDWTANETLKGTFLGMHTSPKLGTLSYIICDTDGVQHCVNQNASLLREMDGVVAGQNVEIKFTGTYKTKTGKDGYGFKVGKGKVPVTEGDKTPF